VTVKLEGTIKHLSNSVFIFISLWHFSWGYFRILYPK